MLKIILILLTITYSQLSLGSGCFPPDYDLVEVRDVGSVLAKESRDLDIKIGSYKNIEGVLVEYIHIRWIRLEDGKSIRVISQSYDPSKLASGAIVQAFYQQLEGLSINYHHKVFEQTTETDCDDSSIGNQWTEDYYTFSINLPGQRAIKFRGHR